jgi:hypothetical protein
VKVEEVIDQYSGGTQSQASVAKVEGDVRFLKSQRPAQHGRYANFESDLLAHDLFELVGIVAPEAEIVQLSDDSPLRQELGKTVLSLEFVDSEFANNQQVRGAGWGLLDGAELDDYLNMTLVDILTGNADRRGANYFERWTSDGTVKPVPIDNNSGFGNLLNHAYPTNHANFIKSYDGVGKKHGLRQAGTIPNILLDTTLHYEIFDEPVERTRALELARKLTEKLTDEKIAAMVEKLPREIIPRGTKIDLSTFSYLEPETVKELANGATEDMSGARLFEFRKQQLKETLAWRRDHLVEALGGFLDKIADPNIDPIKECSDDWNLLNS